MKTSRKAYDKQYRMEHKEQIKETKKRWGLLNPEKVNASSKKYRVAHLEKCRERNKKYSATHRKQMNAADKKWRVAHPEQASAYNKKHHRERYLANRENVLKKVKQYNQSIKGKLIKKKINAKRKQMGFITLNQYFIGSNGHHIDKEQVIFIPAELHKSIRHSVSKNRNMEKINEAAFGFLNGGGNADIPRK